MKKRLLVCDLDNTLYDWVGYFVKSFYSMVDVVVEITGCDRERLLDDFRNVHRRHRDSEHPFALLETETVREHYSGQARGEIAKHLDAAFHAFNSNRKRSLQLYPGVREGLDRLQASGFILVAHTESKLYGVVDRLNRLDLERYFRRIYCKERTTSEHPNIEKEIKSFEDFPIYKVVELSQHQRKPDSAVLLEICRREDVSPLDAAYVGDSMARDIVMARKANVFSAWAKYGTVNHIDQYQKLVRISHWTEMDVQRERILNEQARQVKPDVILNNSFAELVDILSHAE